KKKKKGEDRILSTNSSNSNSGNEDLRLRECFSDDNGRTSSRYRDNCLKLNKLSHLEVITGTGLKRKNDEDININTKALFKRIKDSDPPSELAKPKEWIKEQNSGSIYFNHRPANISGNPVILQHPIFGIFLEDCETITPNDVDCAFVLEATESMSNVFTNENERRDAFKILYRKHYKMALPLEKMECPYVGIAAIIFSGDKFLCDPLTPLLPLFYLHHYQKFMDHLAQTFCAFKKALDALDYYYMDPPKILPSQLEFPYINSFTHISNRTSIQFCYLKQLYKDKLLFLVEQKSNNNVPKQLLVKFTEQYVIDVHKACVDLDDNYEHLSLHVPTEVKSAFKEAVGKMHGAGFLHGDLRDLNIHYQTKKKDDNDGVQVDIKIVDYDWAGRIDHPTTIYPSYLNPKITRHYDAHSGCQIKQDHDDYML
ncbi:16997_t:CDS:2, partial [Entrophospora sp. SA101]